MLPSTHQRVASGDLSHGTVEQVVARVAKPPSVCAVRPQAAPVACKPAATTAIALPVPHEFPIGLGHAADQRHPLLNPCLLCLERHQPRGLCHHLDEQRPELQPLLLCQRLIQGSLLKSLVDQPLTDQRHVERPSVGQP